MNIIEAKNISKSFPVGNQNKEVISDLSLTIKEGEFVSIMGPSGSGKTTLLYLLSGMSLKTSGSLMLFEKDTETLSSEDMSLFRRNKLGFIFQFYNLISNLNVYENVLLATKIAQTKKDPMEVLAWVGMESAKDLYPEQLSGGMRQRVAIARALINDPDIIFADEPTGALDSKNGIEIMEILQKINKEKGKTILMVTHNSDCSLYASRVIYLKDGRIEKDETR